MKTGQSLEQQLGVLKSTAMAVRNTCQYVKNTNPLRVRDVVKDVVPVLVTARNRFSKPVSAELVAHAKTADSDVGYDVGARAAVLLRAINDTLTALSGMHNGDGWLNERQIDANGVIGYRDLPANHKAVLDSHADKILAEIE